MKKHQVATTNPMATPNSSGQTSKRTFRPEKSSKRSRQASPLANISNNQSFTGCQRDSISSQSISYYSKEKERPKSSKKSKSKKPSQLNSKRGLPPTSFHHDQNSIPDNLTEGFMSSTKSPYGDASHLSGSSKRKEQSNGRPVLGHSSSHTGGHFVTNSNLSTMRNLANQASFCGDGQIKQSPSTVKMQQAQNRSQIIDYPSPSKVNGAITNKHSRQLSHSPEDNKPITNQSSNSKANFSCIIMRSNDKQHNTSCQQADLELKRSMLESSGNIYHSALNSGIQSVHETPSMHDIKSCKKALHKQHSKYKQLLKDFSEQQHENQVKDINMQRLAQELEIKRTELSAKDSQLMQVNYENERMFSEMTALKTQSLKQSSNSEKQDSEAYELEQEHMRKKIKRLTGELDALETYVESLKTLIKKTIGGGSSSSSHQALNKFFVNLTDSIDYIRDLFNNSRLNVSQGKRVQRRVRYDRLKKDFQALIAQLTHKPGTPNNASVFSSTNFQSDNYSKINSDIEQERADHSQKISCYKEQVQRMRENIDLFKENIKLLKEQNDELQSRIAFQGNQTFDGSASALISQNTQLQELFEGLKEDNEKLASELKRLQDENSQLAGCLASSKDAIQQQNGIIKALQAVVDQMQRQQMQVQATSTSRSRSRHKEPIQDYMETRNYFPQSERSRSCQNSCETYKKTKPLLLHQFQQTTSSRLATRQLFRPDPDHSFTGGISPNSPSIIDPINTSGPIQLDSRHARPSKTMQRSASALSNHLGRYPRKDMGLAPSSRMINQSQLLDVSDNTHNVSHEMLPQVSASVLLPDITESETAQDQSVSFFQDSFLKYLSENNASDLIGVGNGDRREHYQVHSQASRQQKTGKANTTLPCSGGMSASLVQETCNSPMTARFSTFQLKSQSKGQQSLNESQICRNHIKRNTKNLLYEIEDLDDEIVALQGTLLHAYQTSANKNTAQTTLTLNENSNSKRFFKAEVEEERKTPEIE